MEKSIERQSELALIAERLEESAREIRGMISDDRLPESDSLRSSAFSFSGGVIHRQHLDDHYAALAKKEYDRRGIRAALYPRGWFADPAWDIMLDLFIRWVRGRRVFVSEACHAGRVPPTTALRWVEILIIEGLVERIPSTTDKRAIELKITDEGRRRIRKYFAQAGTSGK